MRAAVLVALPFALALALVPTARDGEGASLAQDLLAYPLLLVAGTILYVCWRVAGDSATGWLAAGLTLLGAQGIGLAAIRVTRPVAAAEHSGWSTSIDLLVQSLLLLLAVLATRHLLAVASVVDPFVAGMAGAVAIVAARVAVLALPSVEGDETAVHVLAALVLAAQVGTAALLLRSSSSTLWSRAAIGVAAILLGVSHFVVSARPLGAVGSGLALAAGLVGTAVVLAGSFALLEVLLEQGGSAVVGLNHRVDDLEADARVDQEHRHEIGSTFAGIANGIHVLRSPALLSEDRRRSLEAMIDSEAARLQRLMDPGLAVVPAEAGGRDDVDLDAVLHPLVTAHRARGRVVRWQPSGLRVRCRPDGIAQVVTILLENAARHGGNVVALTAGRTSDSVEISVSDRGPGVAPALAEVIFLRGHRGTLSTGQGLGLHIAQQLMSEQGGSLRLVQDARVPGATFVARLPESLTAPVPANERQVAGQ